MERLIHSKEDLVDELEMQRKIWVVELAGIKKAKRFNREERANLMNKIARHLASLHWAIECANKLKKDLTVKGDGFVTYEVEKNG